MTKLHQHLFAKYGTTYPQKLAPQLGLTPKQVEQYALAPAKMPGYVVAMLHTKLNMYRHQFEKEYLEQEN